MFYNSQTTTSFFAHHLRFFVNLTRVILASLLVIPLAAYANGPREIRIGIVTDQSSVDADISREYMAGAQTYFDFINTQGGINGQRISVIRYDDAGVPAKTVAATRELIERDRVVALFGYVGDDTVAAVARDEVFRRSGVALFAPLTGIALPDVNDSIFYVRPTYKQEARHVANHFSALSLLDYFVLHTNNVVGMTLQKEIVEELNRVGARSIYSNPISTDAKAIAELTKRIRASQTRVVILAADTITSAEFLRQFRLVDAGTSVVTLSKVNPRTLMELTSPELAAGTILTAVVPDPFLPLTPVQVEHLKLFERFRDEPPSHISLEGFIAAKTFVLALKRAGTPTRASIAATMRGTQRIDVGGITLNYSTKDDRGSKFVDLAFLRRTGKLIY
jgi:branched-chain amino acid transport system substrate-binding protein